MANAVRRSPLFHVAAVLALFASCLPEETRKPPVGGSGGSDTGGTGGGAGGGFGGAVGNGGSGGGVGGGGAGGGGGSGGSGGAGGGTGGSGGGGGTPGTGGSSGSGGSGGSGGGGVDARGDMGGLSPDGAAGGAGGNTGGSDGPFPPGPHKVVLLHAPDDNPGDASRMGMRMVLEGMKATHNIDLEMLTDSQTKAPMLMNKALVIIGPNTRAFSGGVDAAIKDLPVPVIVSKDGTTFMSLGARVAATDPPRDNKIIMVKVDHPLAAGLPMGMLDVQTTPTQQRIIFHTGLGPEAIKIAVSPRGVASNEWSIFAYEKGMVMGNGFRAPAKRVGFFWHRPADATPAGKKLFQAAIEWAIRN
jgi:hypothetical protein